MSESKYNDAWEKGFDSGVESQRQSCLFNCDKDFDEFGEGYNKALEDFAKWVNENQMKEFNIDIMIANKGNANIEDLIKLYLSRQS